jgi:DNA primase small subunit
VDPARRAAYASGSTSAAASTAPGATPSGFAPVERELVFDVDLTDYDDVRTCGSGGHICARCWPLMAAAVAVVDAALEEDFGFSHRLWVFSGRRGVHCWVSDARARGLTDEARSSVAAYLSIYKGVEEGVARLAIPPTERSTTPLHPSVERAAGLLNDLWLSSILPAQRWLDGPGTWSTILSHVPDEGIKGRLVARWTKEGAIVEDNDGSVSVRRWGELEAELAKEARPSPADARNPVARERKAALGRACLRAVLACAYPRLDVDVSKKRNHLLKAPFCVHPKTGKVCVPFAAEEAAGFDPDGVPTVSDLVAASKRKGGKGGMASTTWAGSAMEPAVRFFADKFLGPLSLDSKAALAVKAKEAAAAPSMAW